MEYREFILSERFLNKYRNESARLKGYDYSSPGAYFTTICTKDRKHYFGNINNGTMSLTEIGNISYKYWDLIPHHFPIVKLDEFSLCLTIFTE